MFYTIISRLPIVQSDSSSRRYFKIFLYGSVVYLLLHYYLFSSERASFLEKLKSYIYYIMALDFIVACAWTKLTGIVQEDVEEEKVSHEDKESIMKNIEELRRMQLMRQQALQTQKSPFVKQPAQLAQPEEKSESQHKESSEKVSSKKEDRKKDNRETKDRESKESKESHNSKESEKSVEVSDTELPILRHN